MCRKTGIDIKNPVESLEKLDQLSLTNTNFSSSKVIIIAIAVIGGIFLINKGINWWFGQDSKHFLAYMDSVDYLTWVGWIGW